MCDAARIFSLMTAKRRALGGCAVALVGLVGLWRAVPLEPLRSGRVLPLRSGRPPAS